MTRGSKLYWRAEGSVNGRDISQEAHVDDPYVVSVRCSRFEERKKCTREHERAQVADGKCKEQTAIDYKTSHTLLPCYPGLHLGS